MFGAAETLDFLEPQPVSMIWGVGAAFQAKLKGDGLNTIGDLRRRPVDELVARYGSMGMRLSELSRGEDRRKISSNGVMKSISSETTFNEDIGDRDALDAHLWRLAVRTSDRAKAKETGGRTVTIKLKTPDFRTITRQQGLSAPTNLADTIYKTGCELLHLVADKGPFRLIGVGVSDLAKVAHDSDLGASDLFDPLAGKRAEAERAADRIRARYGKAAIVKGRALT